MFFDFCIYTPLLFHSVHSKGCLSVFGRRSLDTSGVPLCIRLGIPKIDLQEMTAIAHKGE